LFSLVIAGGGSRALQSIACTVEVRQAVVGDHALDGDRAAQEPDGGDGLPSGSTSTQARRVASSTATWTASQPIVPRRMPAASRTNGFWA
jgi:hypothetical protein